MTVASETNRTTLTSSGSLGPYSVGYIVISDADLAVYVAETLKTLTTHYTVANAGTTSNATITFTTGNAPTSGDQIVMVRSVSLIQSYNPANGDAFDSEVLEGTIDRVYHALQELDDKTEGTLKFSVALSGTTGANAGYNTTAETAGTITANKAARLGKALIFHATTGDLGLSATSFEGIETDITALAGIEDDIVALALIEDDITDAADNIAAIVAAPTQASNAATSATAAAGSATASAADAVSTAADVVLTNADVVLAEADKVQTGLDRIAVAADLVATNQDTIDTAADVVLAEADKVQTGLDRVATAADVVLAEADKVQTGLDRVATAADRVATNADVVTTAGSATGATASQVAAANSAAAVSATYDSFNDVYLGSMADGATASAGTATGAWAKNSSTVTVTSVSGTIEIGQVVTGAGIPTSPKPNILSTTGVGPVISFVLSDNMAAADASEALTFTGYGIYGLYSPDVTGKDGPALNNDGDALANGNLYFNTTDNEMRIYAGAEWIAATSAGTASLVVHKYVSDSSSPTSVASTAFTPDLAYTADNIIVFLNGVSLDSTDYTATTGTTITGLAALALSDELVVYAFKSFSTSDMVPIGGGTYTGDVTFNGKIIMSTAKKVEQRGAFMQSSTHQALFLGA